MVCIGILTAKSTENIRVILSEIIELWKRFFESALYFRWRKKCRSLVPGHKELFLIIEEKIKQGNYVFLPHAKQRLKERNITELDVIYLLSGKKGYERKRNKSKDIYESFSLTMQAEDWKYCIEGQDIDRNKLRIIITFTDDLMPIITAIKI